MPERPGRWYAVTILPLRVDKVLEIVHEGEGRVARRLNPVEGTAHPVPQAERSLCDLIESIVVLTPIGPTKIWQLTLQRVGSRRRPRCSASGRATAGIAGLSVA